MSGRNIHHVSTAIITLIASALSLTACSNTAKPKPPFEIMIRTAGDSGQMLAGATVQLDGKDLGVTGIDGAIVLKLAGSEGDAVDLTVTCPAGHQSPAKPTRVTLHQFSDGTKRPEYLVTCPPATRTVVVAVRADQGPSLPVLYLGREVARTDAAGAAHVSLDVRAGDMIELTLDTRDAKELRPQSPVASFVVKQQDDIFVLDQRFTVERARVVVKKRVGPTPL